MHMGALSFQICYLHFGQYECTMRTDRQSESMADEKAIFL